MKNFQEYINENKSGYKYPLYHSLEGHLYKATVAQSKEMFKIENKKYEKGVDEYEVDEELCKYIEDNLQYIGVVQQHNHNN